MIASLGVVFGDIGTSPLYVMHVLFGSRHSGLELTESNILGALSLIIWTLILVVSVKYIFLVMRVDNRGEGGTLALLALGRRLLKGKHSRSVFMLFALVGVALFYGDSVITPAISILSAVEGLKVVTPALNHLILPISVGIIIGLFWIQKYGSRWIGKLFGPIMIVWFFSIGTAGLLSVIKHPAVLKAILPSQALGFIYSRPLLAFISMSVVVLAVTGAEALYADMGHFGRPIIKKAWFFVVFPALVLCYAGQGALLIENSQNLRNPFMLLFPSCLYIPILALTLVATVIASQSVITGAFSLTRQAINLDLLPKTIVLYTSKYEYGQIYMPLVNALLFVAVVGLILLFGTSERLAFAYGLAVSGAILIDSILFLTVFRIQRQKSLIVLIPFALLIFSVEISLFGSSLPKILVGGWLPLSIAMVLLSVMLTWSKGQRIISGERRAMEGSLQAYIDKIRFKQVKVVRVPGQAVYISNHPNMAPLSLHASAEDMHELHEKAVIVSIIIEQNAHVPKAERAIFNPLNYDDGISQLILNFGFNDTINLPRALEDCRGISPELDFDPKVASYFVSRSKVVITKKRNLAYWRKIIYSMLHSNAMSASDYYKLPVNQTVEIRSLIKL